MAERNIPSVITVPSEAKPSIINEGTMMGAVYGSLLGVPFLGGIIGSFSGKRDMEQEYRDGKQVQEPGSKTRSVLTGILLGGMIGAVAATVAVAITLSAAPLLVGAAIGALAGGVAGASGHNSRARAYESAAKYYVEHGGNYRGREIESHQRATSVTKEDMRAIEERIGAMEAKSFAEQARAPHNPALLQQQR